MSRIVLKRGNDQVVALLGLRTTDQPPTYLNDAVVKATLHDSKGQPIPAHSDVLMPYVAGSEGRYEWNIEADDTMVLPKGTEYQLVLTAKQDELNYRVVHMVSVVDG